LAYLLRSGFERATAEDLLQDIFLRLFHSLHTYDHTKGPLLPWIATIARNVARKHWQKNRLQTDFDIHLAQEVLTCEARPDQPLEQREQSLALEDCISLLPDEMGQLIELRYVRCMTTRLMADVLDLAESTVRSRLNLAKKQLEQCMNSKGYSA
jgi:RNA polymerase sigma-70 factor (ECF subfamily)